jgi:hypothetical protein
VAVFVIEREAASVYGNLNIAPQILSAIAVAQIPAAISTIVRPKSLGNVGPNEVSAAAEAKPCARLAAENIHPILSIL